MKTIQYFSEDKALFAFLKSHNHWIYEQVQDYANEHIISWKDVDLEGLFGGCIHIATSAEDLDVIQTIVEDAPEAIASRREIRDTSYTLDHGEPEPDSKISTSTVISTYSLLTNNSGGDIFIVIDPKPY